MSVPLGSQACEMLRVTCLGGRGGWAWRHRNLGHVTRLGGHGATALWEWFWRGGRLHLGSVGVFMAAVLGS